MVVFTVNSDAQTLTLRSGNFQLKSEYSFFNNPVSFVVDTVNQQGAYTIGLTVGDNAVPNSTNGIKTLGFIGGNAYYVWVQSSVQKDQLADAGLIGLYAIQPEWKIAPDLKETIDEISDTTLCSIRGFSFLPIQHVVSRISKADFDFRIIETEALANSITLEIEQRNFADLLELGWFYWFELPPPPVETNNLVERTNHRVPAIEAVSGVYGLSGKRVIVGEWDGSGAQKHIDYDFNHTQVEAFTYNSNGAHATHVAGTVLGAGIIDPQATGMAPNAELVSYDFRGNIPVEMDSAASKYGIELTQNSYSYGSGNDRCNVRGTYDGTSTALDVLTNKYDYLLHVFAAGNSRSSSCLSGGYGTVHSGFQASKNSLAVGALTRTDGNSSFHCYGPVKDGRLKPEICGVGVSVYSTYPYNTYRGGYSGTSMACPGVSGTAALIHELYQDSTSKQIPAHLLKGSLCNGADDMGRSGPDYQFGFGRVNGRRTANIIANKQYRLNSVRNGGVYTDTIFVPSGTHQLNVMLCWNDQAGNPSSSTMLVNDLDLELVDSAGNVILPWTLNPVLFTATALRSRDSLNPIEQVTVLPSSPYYLVRVRGKRVVSSTQDFSVNWLFQDSSITVIYPNGGEHWEAPSNSSRAQTIRWDTYGLNGSTRVEFSADSGQTWTTLASVTSNRRYYTWANASSSLNTPGARIRVTCQGKTDISDNNFNIGGVGPVPQAKICSKQVHLKWSSINNAAYYKVHRMIEGRMVAFDSSVTPFYTVRNLVNDSTYWFAISVVYQSGSEGPRSRGTSFKPIPGVDPVNFVTQPSDARVCAGNRVTLRAVASGSLSIYTEWQRSTDDGESWVDLNSVDTLLRLAPVDISQNGHLYRKKGVNQCEDTVHSRSALIQVDTLLDYDVVHDRIAVCIAQDTVIRVNVEASNPPTIRWKYKKRVTDNEYTVGSFDSLPLFNINEGREGYYRAQVSNTCGLSPRQDFTYLEVRPQLTLTYDGKDTSCVGESLSMDLNATGGDSLAYDFWWISDSDTVRQKSFNFTPTEDVSWVGYVFDNCSSDTITTRADISMRDTLQAELISNLDTACYDQEVRLEVIITGGKEDSYDVNWLDGDNSRIRVMQFTNDTLIYLGVGDGCTKDRAYASIEIPVRAPIQLNILGPDTVCYGELVTYNADVEGGRTSSYKYFWNDVAGNPDLSTVVSKGEVIKLEVSDGCTPQNGLELKSVFIRDPLSTQSFDSVLTICTGQTASFEVIPAGGNPSSYVLTWLDSGLTNYRRTVKPTDTSSYLFVLDDGCSNPGVSGRVVVNVRPPLQLDLGEDLQKCAEDLISIKAKATGGFKDRYVFKENNVVLSNGERDFEDSTTETVIVELSDGCTVESAYDTVTVFVTPLESTGFVWTALDHKTVEIETLSSPNQLTVNWGDGFEEGVNTKVVAHQYQSYGNYEICLKETDNIGCTKSECTTVYIYNPFDLRGFTIKLYPNPVEAEPWILETDSIVGNYDITLFDAAGQEVYSISGENTVLTQFVIPSANLASGVYVISGKLNEKYFRAKLIRN